MKKQQMVALALMGLVTVWMALPRNSAETLTEEPTDQTPRIMVITEDGPANETPGTFTVRARRISAQPYVDTVRVRGRTQAFRHVEVRAEQAGRIIGNPVARGSRVSQGDLLCEIAVDDRQANLDESQSRLEQARFEYEAALDLQARGLQSDVAVAQLQAARESARAAVERARLALEKTRIVAPFDGVVETRLVEQGDLLNIGSVCASVLDDSPMLLVGLVPEQDINALSPGATVAAELISGEQVAGKVSYLARAADPVSRSYRIEVEVDPQYRNIREGITAELMVEADQIRAHRIPSSALTLDDNGQIGVKLLDSGNTVRFANVEIVGDDTDQLNPGIWVTGLSGTVTLITLGQEVVFPGQTVAANFDWDS